MHLVRNYLFLFFIFAFFNPGAQIRLPDWPDSLFTTYYHQRVSNFSTLPAGKEDIIFLGNSITDGGEWNELFGDSRVKNRGISGDITTGVIHRLDQLVKSAPAKIFLLIGVNDLARGVSPDSILKNIMLIADYVKQESSSTKLYIQSILPVNNAFGKFGGHTSKGELIRQVNAELNRRALANHYTFVDLFPLFSDKEGKMDIRYTNDGLHLTGTGYLLWKHLVYHFVYDQGRYPSLLPKPVNLKWTGRMFPLYACNSIVIKDTLLKNEARYLQQQLVKKDLRMKVLTGTSEEYTIKLGISNVKSTRNDTAAYQLTVEEKTVTLEANTPNGLFNGIQTLLQLSRDGVMIETCEITDWPAFSWRGYMIDVGRNYMSLPLLKQQIDVMAAYKLNVFHFHATEDIAWRLGISQYPQLTQPENMLRNKGLYYSPAEIKELIAYCKERHIRFVPEIDMPGHSAAFQEGHENGYAVGYRNTIFKKYIAGSDREL